jgi:hypothetical protein
MLLPLIILSSIAAAAIVFLVWCKRTMDGPTASIVVVDRRTMNSAIRRISQASDNHQWARAHAGLTALALWLNDEIQTGPRRHRREYEKLKAQTETALESVRDLLGEDLTR